MRSQTTYCYTSGELLLAQELLKSLKVEFYSVKKEDYWIVKYEVSNLSNNKPSEKGLTPEEKFMTFDTDMTIVEFKIKHKLSVQQIADVFGVSKPTMQYWLDFKRPSLEFIQVLEILGFDVSDLSISNKKTTLQISDQTLLDYINNKKRK